MCVTPRIEHCSDKRTALRAEAVVLELVPFET